MALTLLRLRATIMTADPVNNDARFAMSVDVEDYFQVWAFSGVIERKSWDGFAPRVDISTRACLDLFARTGTKATFFTLGWVAERFPALIREIVEEGHELASHGFDHEKAFDQTRDDFAADVARTKSILEDTGGVEVRGYRAPGFSINEQTPWAYEALAEAGYRYSSSSHPIAHDHYGDPNAQRNPHVPDPVTPVIEAPVATTEMFGQRVSCAGGGWFRAAPFAVSRNLIGRAADTLSGPVIFYFHPWEIDADQPRIRTAPLKSKFRHYLNLGVMEQKLERLLNWRQWERIDQALDLDDQRAAA